MFKRSSGGPMLNSNQVLALHILFVMILLELILFDLYRRLVKKDKELKRREATVQQEEPQEEA
jgi:hypothetical protein